MKVLFATSNKHKVGEANKIGQEFGVEFKQIEFAYPEIRDNSVSKVALEGVKHVQTKLKKPVIVEDSGLFIAALKDFPGSYSRYVYDKIGLQGMLDLMHSKRDRNAFFVSAVAYSDGRTVKVFEGTVEGEITNTIKGSEGFGYDPIFTPAGHKQTFAENLQLKDEISHRSMAFRKLCRWLTRERI